MSRVLYFLPAPLLLVLLLLCVTEAAGWSGTPAITQRQLTVDTVWHFHGRSLVVDSALPVGTVIAATVVPPGKGLFTLAPGVSGGLWGQCAVHSWLDVETDLTGVRVRIIQEKIFGAPWRQGGVRIELVKTGIMRSGVLKTLQCMPEYRLWRNRPGGRDVLLRERFRMDRPLSVAVLPDGDHVPSGRHRV